MARPRTFEPQRLDLRAFANAGESVAGETAQDALPRLRAGLLQTDAAAPAVRWQARGEWRPVVGSAPQLWLHLRAATSVALQCQRCLQPMAVALQVDRHLRFVADENEAARLDEESEEDVLVESRRFDLLELIEDELILALPIVPRHDTCPSPLPAGAAGTEDEEAGQNPFARLAALRHPPRDS
jgi:uncharacterized protein